MSGTSEQVPALVTTGLGVVSIMFPVLSLACVLLRYYARRITKSGLQADDWWILVSWVFTFGLSIDVWVCWSITGMNHYKIDVERGIKVSTESLAASGLTTQIALTLVKISILLFYKRVFSNPKFKIAVWGATGVVVCWGILFFLLILLQGKTMTASFTAVGGFRYDTTALGVAQVGTSIALDIVVLCFPLPVIGTLHVPTQRKIALGLVFWLGAFCCIAAIVRLVLVKESIGAVAQSAGQAIANQSKQFIFVLIEPNCSIIAACIPCFGPLISGGRAPESIVRSVRSVLSLQSMRSQGSQSQTTGTKTAGGQAEGTSGSLVELGRVSKPQSRHDLEAGQSTPTV